MLERTPSFPGRPVARPENTVPPTRRIASLDLAGDVRADTFLRSQLSIAVACNERLNGLEGLGQRTASAQPHGMDLRCERLTLQQALLTATGHQLGELRQPFWQTHQTAAWRTARVAQAEAVLGAVLTDTVNLIGAMGRPEFACGAAGAAQVGADAWQAMGVLGLEWSMRATQRLAGRLAQIDAAYPA